MFKKVVWATDGSEAADQALALARTLAQEGGGELRVIHCEEIGLWGGGGTVSVHAHEDELKAKIEGQVSELSSAGVPASFELVSSGVGGAAHRIAEAAENWQADLIVVGTRGHTPLTGLLLGSVTQRLLHIAACPVLALPTRGVHASD
jgi:nucleotide-binding universal stress UspA family protein